MSGDEVARCEAALREARLRQTQSAASHAEKVREAERALAAALAEDGR